MLDFVYVWVWLLLRRGWVSCGLVWVGFGLCCVLDLFACVCLYCGLVAAIICWITVTGLVIAECDCVMFVSFVVLFRWPVYCSVVAFVCGWFC